MGDCKIAKAVLRSFVLFAGIVLLNAAQYVKNLDCPPDILRLMVGSKLELKWHYEMNVSFRDSWKINLYVHKSDSKRRKLIELHRGHTELRPGSNSWADKMDLSYTSAKITVLKTTFNHTGDYGIMFVPLNKSKTDILTKYTVVTIVDMLLDEEKSSFVEKTWINEPAELVCAVNLKDNADAPTFKWKHSKNGTVTKNVFKERDRSVLKVNARDVNDFGSYKCQIKTVHTKIKHNMTLKRIEYPGYPTEIVFSRKKLSWLAPMRWKSVFSVQYLINKQKKNWMEVGRTLEKTVHSKSLSKFLPHGVHFCCVRICINVTTTLQNKICSPGKMVEDSPDVSPPSAIHLTYHGNEAILTWSRSDYNKKDILGYVVQIFHGSDYSSKSMTLKYLYEKPERTNMSLRM
ncbi:uncharacterized protein LOC124442049 [Xenia sp. Carnegie-2017]|uniref:uncharacterized protein LOC124442049 n=1 Tax=Xenia sp. Carnegie-2017 TaxID=2897299 RepID=UPI001F03DBA7|nr:uncharacterized protein LOC124442049 [Xenia sp. Carnegie-2017]